MPRYSAFLSYSRKDADLVAPFREAVEAGGLSAWFDRSEISGGDVWEASIARGLTQSNCVVIFVSKNVLGSYAEKEAALARNMRKPIIPIALDDAINTDIPAIAGLREYHYIDARSDVAAATSELVAAIERKDSAPVVSVYNVKGGVGKTTLTMNLGMYLYRQARKRILLVDFDPQTNLSTALVLPKAEKQRGRGLFGGGKRTVRIDVLEPLQSIQKSVLGVLRDAVSLASQPDTDFELARYIHTIECTKSDGPTLDIVVGDPNLHRLATDTSAATTKKVRDGFARFVGQCRANYSAILIDLGPSVNTLSLCALASSTHVLSPVTSNMFAMQGLNLLDDISVGDDLGSAGREHLILLNAVGKDGSELVREQIEGSQFRDALLQSELRFSEHFALKPRVNVNPSLSFLPAYGDWGSNPNTARQSLQNVALEFGKKVGIAL